MVLDNIFLAFIAMFVAMMFAMVFFWVLSKQTGN